VAFSLLGCGQRRSVEQEVEWMYAFDIHCNAYIPGFILLHGVQVCSAAALVHRCHATRARHPRHFVVLIR
jgi:hypothetical protein